MTIGVALVAVWFVAVVTYLLWQFATNALGAPAAPRVDSVTRAFETAAPTPPAARGAVVVARLAARAS